MYFNKKSVIDGHMFDSLAEAEYYKELCLLQKGGEILSFEVKPKIILQKKPRITFTPDFVVYRHGQTEFVDVKSKSGYKTASFSIKWKLLQGMYINEPKGVYEFTIERR